MTQLLIMTTSHKFPLQDLIRPPANPADLGRPPDMLRHTAEGMTQSSAAAEMLRALPPPTELIRSQPEALIRPPEMLRGDPRHEQLHVERRTTSMSTATTSACTPPRNLPTQFY